MYESKYNHHPTVMLTALTQHKPSYLVFNSDSMFASPIRGGMFPSSSTVHRLKKRSRYLSCITQFPEYQTNVFLYFELPVKGTPLDSITKVYKLYSKVKVKLSLCKRWRHIGGAEVQLQPFLTSAQDERSNSR
jgi:hypothetical protein